MVFRFQSSWSHCGGLKSLLEEKVIIEVMEVSLSKETSSL